MVERVRSLRQGRNPGDEATTYHPGLLDAIIHQERLENRTAQDLVLNATRRAILAGVLPPGTRLWQDDLANAFATSRILVIEALRALEYEGLVESKPHRGFSVTTPDEGQIHEVYQLRILLESHAVRLSVPVLTDDDLDELTDLHRSILDAGSPDVELEQFERFYDRLYSISGHRRLVALISGLRKEVARSLRWKRIPESSSHHTEFFEAIKAGDEDRAIQFLTLHYDRVSDYFGRYVRDARREEPVAATSEVRPGPS